MADSNFDFRCDSEVRPIQMLLDKLGITYTATETIKVTPSGLQEVSDYDARNSNTTAIKNLVINMTRTHPELGVTYKCLRSVVGQCDEIHVLIKGELFRFVIKFNAPPRCLDFTECSDEARQKILAKLIRIY